MTRGYPKADLVVLVGPIDGEPAADVRVNARFSRGGLEMTALVGPGGWFAPDQVLARCVSGTWIADSGLPELHVVAEVAQGGRWRPVRSGRINAAPPPESRRRGQRGDARGAW